MVFYCDASVPRAVAQALALVRDDVLYPALASGVASPSAACGPSR